MPKIAKELSPLEVGRLSETGFYSVGGVSGLAMQITPTGARSWILRVKVGEKRRDLGLGAYPQVSLKAARDAARELKEEIAKGVDPVERKRQAKQSLLSSQTPRLTFEKAARTVHQNLSPTLKNAKYRAQWLSLVERNCSSIAGLDVADIELIHILGVLEPIWLTKTDSAKKLRGQIEQILDYAKVSGFREGENPAQWRGRLDKVLPKPSKIANRKHFAALPASGMPEFMSALRSEKGMGARALEFAILCASRSGEVRGARWSEIDLNAKLWTIPGTRMKAGRDHTIPLTDTACELLKALPREEGNDLVFWSGRGGMLSDMTLTAVLRRMGVDCVPHGFRSTFRDWASETTEHSGEVAEMALAHVIPSAVERAYRRGDLLEKRRLLMQDWHFFLSGD